MRVFSLVHAAISPVYTECMERGYQVIGTPDSPEGEFCQFPDGNKCRLGEFNAGTCGQTYRPPEYCVKEGNFVWNETKCCSGLVPYLPEGYTGQATCQKPATTPADSVSSNRVPNSIPIVVGIALVAFIVLIVLRRRR